MESQLRQIGKRIEETRKVLEISVAEMAQITGISQEEYLAHERGEVDHSFTFIYRMNYCSRLCFLLFSD